MTKEEKQLLLKDLRARLSYGVICHTDKGDGYLCSINQTIIGTKYGLNISPVKRDYFNDSEQDDVIIKPYLRPMSSMTEKERKEIENIFLQDTQEIFKDPVEIRASSFYDADALDWYLKKHFDYRKLIEKGLALEAPNDIYI